MPLETTIKVIRILQVLFVAAILILGVLFLAGCGQENYVTIECDLDHIQNVTIGRGQEYDQKITFGVIADVHKDRVDDADERLSTFVQDATDRNVDFIIQLGDFCRPDERNREFVRIFNSYKSSYHVIGNHDREDGFTRQDVVYFYNMPNQYYSFDMKNIHFIVLDGNDKHPSIKLKYPRYIGQAQLDWLILDLENTNFDTVIFIHQTLGNDSGVLNNAEVRQVLESSEKVIAVFNGHHHLSEHTIINSISYIQIDSASYFWNSGVIMYDEPRYAFVNIYM